MINFNIYHSSSLNPSNSPVFISLPYVSRKCFCVQNKNKCKKVSDMKRLTLCKIEELKTYRLDKLRQITLRTTKRGRDTVKKEKCTGYL